MKLFLFLCINLKHLSVMIKKLEEPECKFCDPRFKSIFCDLHGEEMDTLNDAKDCIMYKKGQVIFSEGTRPRGLYCVHSGKIKASKIGDEGKEQILHLAKDGDVLGYRAILSGDNYSCTATALEDSSICFIPKSVFFSMVEKDSNLSLQVIKLLSSELKTAEKSITDIAQKPVRERVAETLLILKETYGCEEDGSTINVSLSREEIANIVGTATESAIRVLSEFKGDEIVELHGKKIKILNLPKLIKTANVMD